MKQGRAEEAREAREEKSQNKLKMGAIEGD